MRGENLEGSYTGMDTEAEDEVRRIAREMSEAIEEVPESASNEDVERGKERISSRNPLDDEAMRDDPRLDPKSAYFDSKVWIRTLRAMMDDDEEYFKPVALGVAYKGLRAVGVSSEEDYQATILNAPLKLASTIYKSIKSIASDDTDNFEILKAMDGVMERGTVNVVLGRPGAGCTTLLKSLSSQTNGFSLSRDTIISYDGLTPSQIRNNYRGNVTYSAEADVHFPQLTVGQTLNFVSELRVPRNRPRGMHSKEEYAKKIADVYMAMYGLSHARNTPVGNDFVLGVSGGERKRVSIAEVSICGAHLQCWDNATRGLDSATALEFVRALRTQADALKITSVVAIYQCSQEAFDLFDNCILLYEGYQIFQGPVQSAKAYFERMGFECPERQTTPDFLTSITNPAERKLKKSREGKKKKEKKDKRIKKKKVPYTAREFYEYWLNSKEKRELSLKVDKYLSESREFKDESKDEFKENLGETLEITKISRRNENLSSSSNARKFAESHRAKQAKRIPNSSPFTASFFSMQVKALLVRNWQRMKASPGIALTALIGRTLTGIIIASLFYNLPNNTSSFYERGSALYFGVLFSCFSSVLEILALFEARPVVEKHKQYALYRPSAEALASIISELPSKLIMIIFTNIAYYFMINFRRSADAFFLYVLMCFLGMLAISHIFRTIGALHSHLSAAMTPASLALLVLCMYTGFAVPTTQMLPWSRWIAYFNPISYVFEILLANEFHDRSFQCATLIPSGPAYDSTSSLHKICAVVGSKAGETTVAGDNYLKISFQYFWSHRWRNFGIVIAFIVFFFFTYLIATEINQGAVTTGERTIFIRSKLKKIKKARKRLQSEADVENGDIHVKEVDSYENTSDGITESGALKGKKDEKLKKSKFDKFVLESSQSLNDSMSTIKMQETENIFHWRRVCYDVKGAKKKNIRLLDQVDGWVQPGTLTALMGASGAGKTTLLDVLASRVTVGKVSGEIFVNGVICGEKSFQRKIGYARQQDLHLETSTVREALIFSALLRQPASVPKAEKLEYVETVIDVLEMRAYADAVVGRNGEGLNVEQKKRLTIGVELAAKPKLLLFLDEPTSGLDSQTSWSIISLLRRLADFGQTILCTIHQPSAHLFSQFDRLLLLEKGGRTIFFGDIGVGAEKLINYFENLGTSPCPADANPAEWMLKVTGAAPGFTSALDFHAEWVQSKEYREVQKYLDVLETQANLAESTQSKITISEEDEREYAAGFFMQYAQVTKRTFQVYYRNPTYIWSKIALSVATSLFNGFTFYNASNSMQGLQNQMLSVFMSLTIFTPILEQMIPIFATQRTMYESRERPSKTFSWLAWLLSQFTVEMPFQVLAGTVSFLCWFYPVGFYHNMSDFSHLSNSGTFLGTFLKNNLHERSFLAWLIIVSFYTFISSFGMLCSAAFDSTDAGANIAAICFSMIVTFCGILRYPTGFWTWMYYTSPFTWLVKSFLATTLGNAPLECSKTELLHFPAPINATSCLEYMKPFIDSNGGGYLVSNNGSFVNGSLDCSFCIRSKTDQFLASVRAPYSERWRNWGIFICYTVINLILCVFVYWLVRVPSKKKIRSNDTKNVGSNDTGDKEAIVEENNEDNDTEMEDISSYEESS